MRFAQDFKEFLQAPFTKGLACGVEEDETAQTIVNELHKAALHHFFVQIMIGQQGDLVGVELRHVFAIQFTTNSI